ncbi:MAG: hypothetical protein COA38_10915 [Fluviicola sp.]|nr:MAG: hypothetical protein COA38_10915 [Fluviicola sp.]
MKHLLLLVTLLFSSSFTNAQATDSLKVVSWNVFLRPGILRDKQVKRVDSIAASLLQMNADVIVLQEVFHKKSRRRLISALSKSYPFHSKIGKKSIWGVPSGNCIFSKDSILSEEFIYFKRSMNADKLAKKGAIAVEINHLGKSFKIHSTHLQAGGGTEGAHIRTSQLDQLAEMTRSMGRRITSLFAGDFNIRHDDSLFKYIVKTLNVTNLNPVNQKLGTSNFDDHTLTSTSGTPKWIDFIFLSSYNGVQYHSSHIEEPRCFFKKKRARISDHNPIITIFSW